MNILIITLPLVSFLLLAAHSLRGGEIEDLALFLILPFFLIKKNGWIPFVLAAALFAGSFIWISTTIDIARFRIDQGVPWIRMASILVAVFFMTIFSALLLLSKKSKKRFSYDKEKSISGFIIFVVTFFLLELIRIKAPYPLLLADRFLHGAGRIESILLALYAVWIGSLMSDPEKSPKIRSTIWVFFSAVFFTQLLLGLSGINELLMTGKLHLPIPALIISGSLYHFSTFFMPILFVTTVILAGPAWCSHLCYLGSWDEVASKSKNKINIMPGWAKNARIGIFISAFIIPLLLAFFQVSTGLAVLIASLFGICGVLLILIVSRKKGVMVHCTAYCPVGFAANLLGRLSPWRIRIGAGCTLCMNCSAVCRYDALRNTDLAKKRPGLTCTLCGDCISSCNSGQIHYFFPGLSSENARRLFISMIVVIHTVFLAVARI